MGVKVRDFKGDGNAWIVVHDKRLPKGRARLYVGRDWKKADGLAAAIEKRLKVGDLSWAMREDGVAPSNEARSGELMLKRAVKEYLDERVRFQTMDQSTRENYERELRRHCYPTLGDRSVLDIDREDLKGMFVAILNAGLSKAVCRNILAPIRGSYEWLRDERKIEIENPATRFGKLIGEKIDKKRRVKPLTVEQQVALLAAARRSRFYFMFLVAVGAGLRLSECFGLQWGDFDVEARVLTVSRQFREGRLIDRTKKNKVREIPLSHELCEEYRLHRRRVEDEAKRRKCPMPEWVFVTRLWQPIRSKSSFIRKHLQPILNKARLTGRRVTMQHLRQTFVSELTNSGYLSQASEYAGHSSVKITSDYYSRANLDPAVVDMLDVKRAEMRTKLRRQKLRRVR